MLTNADVEKIKRFDRLLKLDNETINDLLDQAVTVANIVEPDPNGSYEPGPLEKLMMLVNYLDSTVKSLESKTKYKNTSYDPNTYSTLYNWNYNSSTYSSTNGPIDISMTNGSNIVYPILDSTEDNK